ncbi:hypothetical protein PMAYCL1PPCAC_32388, partial [Pristionchus mayeri]
FRIAGPMMTVIYAFTGEKTVIVMSISAIHTGCNPEEYMWCESEQGTPFALFTGVMIVVMGLVIPSSGLSLDTIYSKILGNIDQNLMQALFGAAENLMMVIGPIYAT